MSEASETYPQHGKFTGADGEIYTVMPLSINGMVKIEEKYGFESIEEAFDTARLELQKPKNLRWMLATILQEAHPEMTEEKAGAIINVRTLQEAQVAVVWAFTAALPVAHEPEDGDQDGQGEPPNSDPSQDGLELGQAENREEP